MQLHGQQLIGGERSARGAAFRAIDPSTGKELDVQFHEGTADEADRALRAATEASGVFGKSSPQQRAALLDAIAKQIEAIGDSLLERANAETALGTMRLTGERGRTCNQLRMFARIVEEGSWVRACIDTAIPDRKPLPKPDIRRMLMPVGPVVSFSASNFPLAISVAGNDLSSAFAVGCPVVVKNHPGHPGTSELVAEAVYRAIADVGLPAGIFSMINGRGHEIGLALVRHPLARAVGFTGSLRGGKALFDAVNARPEPIPVFAEMGSINPVFVLPGALAERGQQIAVGLRGSVTLGVGQFCTNPGLVIGLDDDRTRQFADQAANLMAEAAPATMLYAGIRDGYVAGIERFRKTPGVKVLAHARTEADAAKTQAAPTMLGTDVDTFLKHHALSEEVFGPSTLLVTGRSKEDLLRVAQSFEGQLTATVHGTPDDFEQHRDLIDLLKQKVGRIIFNGYPTGIEPCPSVHHGGPWPATSDGRYSSIGSSALERWARPICYQDCPQVLLPDELKDANPRSIWRLVNGEWKK